MLIGETNYVNGFDPELRSYDAVLPRGTVEVRVRTVANDPEARISVVVFHDGKSSLLSAKRETDQDVGVGGSDLVVSAPVEVDRPSGPGDPRGVTPRASTR